MISVFTLESSYPGDLSSSYRRPQQRLPSSVGTNNPDWATEEAFQKPTRPFDDVKILTKGLQDPA